MDCLIHTSVRAPVPAKLIRQVVAYVLRAEKTPKGVVSVNVIGDAKMRRLNAQYRGKDRTTDVLSFSAREGGMPAVGDEVGDIFISASQIARQAKEFGVPVGEEFVRMLVHGVLHALGYDHISKSDAKIMFGKQEKYVKKCIG